MPKKPFFSKKSEKYRFYEAAAKRYKAELRLYGATAAIHLENKNDEVFWGKVLKKAYPEGKFRFIASSRNEYGNETCGCTQCMQYYEFLDDKLWIAIDSDYRYLGEEPGIDVDHYVLQTYTYSFENHFCFGPNLNSALEYCLGRKTDFDFDEFVKSYSYIIYPVLVWQLYLHNINQELFPLSVFHRLLSVTVPKKFYLKNGAPVLDIIKDRTRKMISHFYKEYPDADLTWFEARCNSLGVRRDNAYLFVRGHNIYDLIEYMGRNIVAHERKLDPYALTEYSFEEVMTKKICFGQYPEIINLIDDIKYLREKHISK